MLMGGVCGESGKAEAGRRRVRKIATGHCTPSYGTSAFRGRVCIGHHISHTRLVFLEAVIR